MSKRTQHAPEFQATVALEALKGEATVSGLASRSGVHPTMINQWKGAPLDGASGVFERDSRKAPVIAEDQVRDLPLDVLVASLMTHVREARHMRPRQLAPRRI